MPARLGRLAPADRRARADALRLRERADGRARRPAEHASDGRFRAPGFVEGTFGLECALDELAAKLDLDPLEVRRRNHADHDPMDERPFSAKELMECYRRAEPQWERRNEVRARSEGPWKRGVGLATQLWYGGGGPPSYAWVRLGGDGTVTVVTAMQDIGTGTRTAMAQIAAEELGIPLERVDRRARRHGARPVRGRLRRLLDDAVDGPGRPLGRGRRRPPADRDRGAALRDRGARPRLENGKIVSELGGSWAIEDVTGLLEDGQILGKGARGPNPTGMRVLTFGIQVAEVAVDVETGEVVVDRIYAVHDVGRVINPLGAESQIEGGVIQAIGHTLSEKRLLDPQTGKVLTRTLDSYKLPTFADVPEIVAELVDKPDAHLTNLGAKGLGEPPIVPTAAAIVNAIRDATGADVREIPVDRETMLRALAEAREREKRGAPAAV